LFYGFKGDSQPQCSIAPGSTNWYAGSEGLFRATPPINSNSPSFLVTMITASNLPLAKLIVDQGVSSDFTFPTQTTYLVKGSDKDRNVRFVTFDNAIFNTRLRGNYAMQRIQADSISFLGLILGAQTGSFTYPIVDLSFVPGAMADNLTSYGGQIFDETGGHLNILAFLAAGAAGSYGTVDEPCNYLEKFPSPQNYFYQARGFVLAESYYQSLTNPYQGLVMGEPLAAPFARPSTGSWSHLPENSLLHDSTNLSLSFDAADSNHPLHQVDLFVDGTWNRTLTNIAPNAGNVVGLNVRGTLLTYTVPPGATIKSVVDDLTVLLNGSSNSTQVAAFAYGDRLELHSLDLTTMGSDLPISVTNSPGGASALTTTLYLARSNFLDTIASGTATFQLTGTPPAGSSLQLSIVKTNGDQLTLNTTNAAPGGTLSNLVQQLVTLINSDELLFEADGCVAQDFLTDASNGKEMAQFSIVANSPGWAAARIQANLVGTDPVVITPTNMVFLEDNLEDLQPRNHLYVTAGITNLALAFALDTTLLQDGYHELSTVCYEGTHVRTQKRVSRNIQIQNTALAANLTPLLDGTNIAVEATLNLSVTANTGAIARIDLFSTGGLYASVFGQSNAIFAVPCVNLGAGVHPFSAVVTDQDGHQYRTQSRWISVVGPEAPFDIQIAGPPVMLQWPTTFGRSYEILGAPSMTASFDLQAGLTATNSIARWAETNLDISQRYYRVRAVY
jgi:hypothetical protein